MLNHDILTLTQITLISQELHIFQQFLTKTTIEAFRAQVRVEKHKSNNFTRTSYIDMELEGRSQDSASSIHIKTSLQ